MMAKDRRPTSLADQLSGLQSTMRENAQASRTGPGTGRHQSTGSAPESRAPIDVSDMEQQMLVRHALNNGGSEAGPASRGSAPRNGIVDRRGRAIEVSKKSRPPKREIDPSRVPGRQSQTPAPLIGNLTPAARARLERDELSFPPVPPASPITDHADEASRSDVPATRSAVAPAGVPKSCKSPVEEAFDHIRDVVKRSTPAIEARPSSVRNAVSREISDHIDTGSRLLAERPERDESGYLVGFDFGTSSLKVVFHQPYAADDPVAAMEVPKELRSRDHPYLWQTVIWFDPVSQEFSLVPSNNATPLDGFKTGIIAGYDGELIRPEVPVTRADAAVAFIALHMAHLTGWYVESRPLGPAGGSHFLSFNFGIPTAAHDDAASFGIFQRILSAARAVAADCANLNLEKVRQAYRVSSGELPPGYVVVPELCAALAGYAKLPTSYRRSHVLVDVGASTLDIVAFNLNDDDEGTNIAAFSAGVELLGAAALDTAREAGIDDKVFRSACDHQFNLVYKRACLPTVAPGCFRPSLRREPVQLVTTGGGCATEVHAAFVDSMPGRILGDRKIYRPKPPKHMTRKRCDSGRLLLAYGLAQDEPDILRIKLPSQIEPLPLADDGFPSMIGKDQV